MAPHVSWIFATTVIAAAVLIYTALINKLFLRCPHCRKVGAWRFDNLGSSIDEFDDDGHLVKCIQRQSCRKCGGQVEQIWSDFDGRQIRKAGTRQPDLSNDGQRRTDN